MNRHRLFILVTLLTTGAVACPSHVAAEGSQSVRNGAWLYNNGQFPQSEQAYAAELNTSVKTGQAALEKVARSLLGLARSQAAQGHWAEAERTFYHALAVAQTANLERTFQDQVRAGLVEAQLKDGHTESETSVSAADLPPLPVPAAKPKGAPPEIRPGYIHTRNLGLPILRGMSNTQVAHTPEEDEYLYKCDINYCQQVFGPTSLNAVNANLDLAMYYLNQHDIVSMNGPLSNVTANLPKMSSDDQRRLSTPVLDLAVRLANADQPLLASQIAQPMVKMATPKWGNLSDVATRFSNLSDVFERKHDTAQAENFQKYAVALLERTAEPGDGRLAAERIKLADRLASQNKSSSALELYEMAAPVMDSVGQRADAIKAYVGLINAYNQTNAPQKAAGAVPKLVAAIDSSHADERDTSWYRPTLDLAAAFALAGDMQLCRTIYKAALVHICNTTVMNPGYDLQLQAAVRQLATRVESAAGVPEAENVYLCLVEAHNKGTGDGDGSTGAYADLAQFYINHNMYDKAKSAADHVASNITKIGKTSHYYSQLNQLSHAFEPQHPEEALSLTLCAIDLNPEASSNNDIREVVDNYARAGALEDKLADHDKAVSFFDKAIENVTRRWPADMSGLSPQFTAVVHHQIQAGHVDNASRLLVELAQQLQFSRFGSLSQRSSEQMTSRLAFALDQEQMTDAATALYRDLLEKQAKEFGESSIQAYTTMSTLSNSLRTSGKAREAMDMQEGAQAIRDMYTRQNRGESGVYQPFAPLKDTVQRYRLHHISPDTST